MDSKQITGCGHRPIERSGGKSLLAKWGLHTKWPNFKFLQIGALGAGASKTQGFCIWAPSGMPVRGIYLVNVTFGCFAGSDEVHFLNKKSSGMPNGHNGQQITSCGHRPVERCGGKSPLP